MDKAKIQRALAHLWAILRQRGFDDPLEESLVGARLPKGPGGPNGPRKPPLRSARAAEPLP